MNIAIGDLVRLKKSNKIGVVIEIFGDLDPSNPWVRVAFKANTHQWCKSSGLEIIKEGAGVDPLSIGNINDSL
jgi:rRNA processing protein Gar1|tara:strand:+ start:396 stop:614 length:219 start_codon:yes stop_codon:yes gene_type:complete